MIETKLDGKTKDIVSENISKMKNLFPEVFQEDTIDFDKLKQLLNGGGGKYEVNADDERYNFTWKGKTESIQIAQTPSTGTLRPCKEESKNWDTTQNLYIEGDNLEVLKLLQKTYSGKIKMIYIDPPYNTGKDFVYKDNYRDNLENYIEQDENGFKTSSNQETRGRYHTNWLNMMYPRLKLARNLLKEDGVIFISIDDNEIENLKKICNEIFGENNFIGQYNWHKSETPPNLSKKIKKNLEYILVYEKIKNNVKYTGITKKSKSDNGLLNQSNSEKILIFPKNRVITKMKDGIIKKGKYGTKNYTIFLEENTEIKKGIFIKDVILRSKFKWTQNKLLEEIEKGTKIFIKTKTLSPSYEKTKYDPEVPSNLINKLVNVQTTENAGNYLQTLFNSKKVFDYPKPISLLCYLRNFINNNENEIILDFFSGSSTTAHAILKNNILKNIKDKFIMVQLPEQTDEKSEAYKAGFSNICEIGKERIRRAGDKIVEESGNSDLDIGFKVFKLDSSNIMKWNPDYNNLKSNLLAQTDNLVDGRSNLDLVYEIMLKYGIDITLPIDEYENDDYKLYSVGAGALIICLDNMITKDVANSIIDLKNELNPFVSRVVLKDSGFVSDADKVNVREILKNNEIEEFITI